MTAEITKPENYAEHYFDINNDEHMIKLATAVAKHESGHFKSDACVNKNNCWGLMGWDKNRVRYQLSFNSYEDGQAHFISLWRRVYKKFPNEYLAKKYSGNDRAKNWLNSVQYFYDTL